MLLAPVDKAVLQDAVDFHFPHPGARAHSTLGRIHDPITATGLGLLLCSLCVGVVCRVTIRSVNWNACQCTYLLRGFC